MAKHELSYDLHDNIHLALPLGDHYLFIVREAWIEQHQLDALFPHKGTYGWTWMMGQEDEINNLLLHYDEAHEILTEFLSAQQVDFNHELPLNLEKLHEKGLTAAYVPIPSAVPRSGKGNRNLNNPPELKRLARA